MRSWQTFLLALVVAAPAGCGDGSTDPVVAARVVIAPEADTLNAPGDTARLVAAVTDADGREIPDAVVEWASLDPAVATVDGAGRVIGREVGLARVRAAVGGVADTAEVLVRNAVAESELVFARLSAAAPSLAATEGSFWAVSGETRRFTLRYVPEPGETEGEEFLEFEVSGNSLLAYPDGTAFQRGDSVEITVRVDDAGRFLFHFEPSGLRFDPEHPAELEVSYRHADPDFDGDGDVDGEDDDVERELHVWKQELEGAPWMRLGTVRFDDLDEVEAKIDGFTGFAVAR